MGSGVVGQGLIYTIINALVRRGIEAKLASYSSRLRDHVQLLSSCHSKTTKDLSLSLRTLRPSEEPSALKPDPDPLRPVHSLAASCATTGISRSMTFYLYLTGTIDDLKSFNTIELTATLPPSHSFNPVLFPISCHLHPALNGETCQQSPHHIPYLNQSRSM